LSFFNELKRRKVIRVGTAYALGAWLVAQVTEMSAESFGAPEWVMQMLLIVLAIGLPVTLVLAWAFELTPAGIKRDSEVEPGTRSSGGTLNKLLLGLLVTALAYFIWESRFQTPTGSSGVADTTVSQDTEAAATEELEKSIAVLPFENFSGNEADRSRAATGTYAKLVRSWVCGQCSKAACSVQATRYASLPS